MLYVIGCITQQHDLRLVLLAGFLCVLASGTALGMIGRAQGSEARLRAFWLLAAGTVAGSGIWGTHFVAMLAFQPGLPVGYDAALTALSVLIAASLCSLGFTVALRPRSAAFGGAIIGAAISAMHYAGMAAVRIPADAVWNKTYVLASVLIGIALSALAMTVSLNRRTLPIVQGTALFTLAICGMHFTAMTAVTYVPNPLMVVPDAVLDRTSLAMAVAAGAILIVGLGLTGVLVDNHLAWRAAEESVRLRAYVRELEATKAQLEETSANLSAALVSADAANKAKSKFLAAMSHELRTPLNAVIGFSEMMQKEVFGPVDNAQYRDYIGSIQTSGAHLLRLINDVLEISRLDAGEVLLCEERATVSELIAEAICRVTPQAESAKLQILEEVEPGLPALFVDRKRMRQALINLMSNAVKFSPPGGRVSVSAGRHPEGIFISVSDTGIGIAQADLSKALERFGQVDSRLSRKYEGVGLGLPLAKQLVELHGGRLELVSAPGAGTTVTVILPRERVHSALSAA